MSARRVSSGREALQVLEESYFDLVLSDVKMPEMDGLELLERTRADYPEIPVVLLTGFGTIEMAVEAMRAGAASFVVKPYKEELLVETLRKALQTAPEETAFPREPRTETAPVRRRGCPAPTGGSSWQRRRPAREFWCSWERRAPGKAGRRGGRI